MATVTHRQAKGYRTLRLPICEADYERFMNDREYAKAQLAMWYERHPEWFPVEFEQGYALSGFTALSRKQHRRCRRLRLSVDGAVWTVAPACVLPSMSATVGDVEKALFLMRFPVPYGAMA